MVETSAPPVTEPSASSSVSGASLSSLYTPCILVLLIGMLVVKTVVFSRGHGEIVDFDSFHIVGRMVLHGHAIDAYHFSKLMPFEMRGGHPVFLAWSYPPQFELMMAGLALLPVGVAYVVFTGLSLLAYLKILHRAAEDSFPTAILFCMPALLINVTIGQNGLLTGALMGAGALGLATRNPLAGVPLGLMVIKPHLAASLAWQTLAGRRWGSVLVAAATVGVTAILATVILSPEIWAAFLHGAREAAAFLDAGQNPLHRMVSVYATLRTFGAPTAVALAFQGLAALVILAALTHLAGRVTAKQAAGFALLTATAISPYAYDYDLAIVGMGLAMLTADLQRRARDWELIAVFALFGVAGLSGMAESAAASFAHFEISADQPPPSLGGVAMLAVIGVIWRIVVRPEPAMARTTPAI